MDNLWIIYDDDGYDEKIKEVNKKMAKELMKNKFVMFLTENWMGGVIGLIVAPMIAVIAMGPFKAFMMSFTVGSFTLSGAGYLAGAAIQNKFFK